MCEEVQIKVLHVLNDSIPNIAGYTTRAKYIVDSQKAIGFSPTVITSLRQIGTCSTAYHGCLQQEYFNGIAYYRSNNFKKIKIEIPLLRELTEINNFLKNIDIAVKIAKPNIIHAHSPILVGYPASKIAKRYSIPFVYEIRAFWEDAAVDQGKMKQGSVKYRLIRHLETRLLKKSDAVVVICEGLKNDLLKRGIKKEKIFVVPNAVDTQRFKPIVRDEGLYKQLSLTGKKVIGYIGTLYNFEGIKYLVEAMNILKDRQDVVCLIIGYGQSENIIKQLINNYGLENKVRFLGKVPHAQVNSYYSVIDILVYPRISRRITELVTPLKPLEAMAMKKTVIASDVGGLKELICDRNDGLLFKAEDPHDLAGKILFLLNNDKSSNELGENAGKNMIKKRNWLEIVKKYQEVYDYARGVRNYEMKNI